MASSSSSNPINIDFIIDGKRIPWDSVFPVRTPYFPTKTPDATSTSGAPVAIEPEVKVDTKVEDQVVTESKVESQVGANVAIEGNVKAEREPAVKSESNDEVKQEQVVPPAKVVGLKCNNPAYCLELYLAKLSVFRVAASVLVLLAIIGCSVLFGMCLSTSTKHSLMPAANKWQCDDDSDLPSIVCIPDEEQGRVHHVSLKSALNAFISTYQQRVKAAEESLALWILMDSQTKFVARSHYDILVWRDEVYVLKRAIAIAKSARSSLDGYGADYQTSVDMSFSMGAKGWVTNAVAFQHLHHELRKYNVGVDMLSHSIRITDLSYGRWE